MPILFGFKKQQENNDNDKETLAKLKGELNPALAEAETIGVPTVANSSPTIPDRILIHPELAAALAPITKANTNKPSR
jgi:hypothetical protein